jgi:hypothetical protein
MSMMLNMLKFVIKTSGGASCMSQRERISAPSSRGKK